MCALKFHVCENDLPQACIRKIVHQRSSSYAFLDMLPSEIELLHISQLHGHSSVWVLTWCFEVLEQSKVFSLSVQLKGRSFVWNHMHF